MTLIHQISSIAVEMMSKMMKILLLQKSMITNAEIDEEYEIIMAIMFIWNDL